MENKNQPIHPVLMQKVGGNEYRANKPSDPKEFSYPMAGLTKREYFAAKAMQGLLASPSTSIDEMMVAVPYDAVRLADALLAELSKP